MKDPKDRDLPIAQRRGLDSHFEPTCTFAEIFVLGNIEGVADAFAKEMHATRWERDVFGRSVQVASHRVFFLYQLRGHPWTRIAGGYRPKFYDEHVAERLSKTLNARTVSFIYEDTSCCMGYSLYESGDCTERMQCGPDYSGEMEEIMDQGKLEKLRAEGKLGGLFFKSSRRQLKEGELKGGEEINFIDAFFQEQGIYVHWMFDWSVSGGQASLQIDDVKLEDLVRVDLIAA